MSPTNPEFFRDKRCLITGGLGFIGSNLARALLELGAHITLVDSLIPEYGGNLFNVDGIEPWVRINISDVRDRFSMRALVKDQDLLFNLAGQTSHLDSMHNPYGRHRDQLSRANLDFGGVPPPQSQPQNYFRFDAPVLRPTRLSAGR